MRDLKFVCLLSLSIHESKVLKLTNVASTSLDANEMKKFQNNREEKMCEQKLHFKSESFVN